MKFDLAFLMKEAKSFQSRGRIWEGGGTSLNGMLTSSQCEHAGKEIGSEDLKICLLSHLRSLPDIAKVHREFKM